MKWPARAVKALVKFFEPLQDVDVFVEDQGDEAFYSQLFNRVCNGSVRISRVFALGGREAVVAAARVHTVGPRPSLFLIDGDLNWFMGRDPPYGRPLFRLDCYCVENLLISEHACIEILMEEAILTRSAAAERLQFENWLESITLPLVELFSAYAVMHELNQDMITCGVGVGAITGGGSLPHLDARKAAVLKEEILSRAREHAEEGMVQARYEKLRQFACSLDDPLDVVSGKDYLLPLLDFHLRRFGCRVRRANLRVRLAAKASPTRFKSLVDAVRQASLLS